MEILDQPGWLWGLSLIVLTMAIHATAVVMLAFVPHGWYLNTSPIITADWLAASGERWTVPVGGGLSHGFSNTSLSYKLVKVAVYAEAVDFPRGYWS